MVDYAKIMLRLESQFAGATDPATMGTTGLVAWVCVAGGMRLYTRFRTARAIIRKRLGKSALPGFERACIAAAPCQHRKGDADTSGAGCVLPMRPDADTTASRDGGRVF